MFVCYSCYCFYKYFRLPPLSIFVFAAIVTTLAGSATSGSMDGIGSAAKFNNPRGVTIDTVTGMLFVADSSNNKIRVIDTATGEGRKNMFIKYKNKYVFN